MTTTLSTTLDRVEPPTVPNIDPLSLAPDEVHCWWVGLDVPRQTAARLHGSLSVDERERSARFRFERERWRFIVARGVLRDILGRYLQSEPGGIRFAYNAWGKPGLAPGYGGRLEFNLSHSAGHALIAIATHVRVGVDLETVRWHEDHAEIARRFFSSAEVEQLSNLPRHRYTEAFLGCWTKKEAFLKACGQGLNLPLDRVSVPMNADPAQDPVDLWLASENPVAAGRWSFHTLRPAPGYIGALALGGGGQRLNQRWNTCDPLKDLDVY